MLPTSEQRYASQDCCWYAEGYDSPWKNPYAPSKEKTEAFMLRLGELIDSGETMNGAAMRMNLEGIQSPGGMKVGVKQVMRYARKAKNLWRAKNENKAS